MTTAYATVKEVIVEGITCRVEVGSVVEIEGRSVSERLMGSDWDAADFRYPCYSAVIQSVAVNVSITGRTLQRRSGSDALWVKARVEFVGDGEESRYAGAWFLAVR